MFQKFVLTLLMLIPPVFSQAKGINFRNITLEEAQTLAGKENKLVFVDCYTPTCGPCKFMAKNIFPMDSCGTFMNPKFVSVMKDLAADENIYIAERFNVQIYPSFLILRPDGSLYAKIEGGAVKNAAKFISRVENALALGAMDDRYASGERGIEFLNTYVEALQRPAPKKAQKIISDYILTLSVDDMANEKNLAFMTKLNDAECEGYRHMIKNRRKVASKIGKERFGAVLGTIYKSYSTRRKMMGQTPSEKAIALQKKLHSEGFLHFDTNN